MLAQTLGAFCASGVVYGMLLLTLYLVPFHFTSHTPHPPNTADHPISLPANYLSAINTYEGSSQSRTVPTYSPATATGGIFCTYPQPFMTRLGMFFSEFLASAILMFCIFALQDDRNLGAGKLMPLVLFFVIFGIGACFGWETGYAINFARDFGECIKF